jgi:hypothetical protein
MLKPRFVLATFIGLFKKSSKKSADFIKIYLMGVTGMPYFTFYPF